MALNSVNIPIATAHKTKLDLSCDHATTMNFMQLQPINYRHCIKGESLNFDCYAKVIPAPIEVPLFGRCRLNLRGFYVPYSLVFPNWDAFYNDVIASNYSTSSLVSNVPTLSSAVIHQMFMQQGGPGVPSFGLVELVQHDPSDPDDRPLYDFSVGSDQDPVNNAYYRYTRPGRKFLKILESLGYKHIIPGYNSKNEQPVVFNALILLAYAKVYIDWFANSQYLNSNDVLGIERLIKYNDPSGHLNLSYSDLYLLLSLVGFCIYDSDGYFMNAWDNPVSPNSGQFTSFSFADPTSNNGSYVVSNSLGSPEMRIGLNDQVSVLADPSGVVAVPGSGSAVGTTYIHEALKKLSDFQKRHALAGARSIDRTLAQYGFVSDNLKAQRSVYVGSQSIDVEIGQIYGTANSTNSDGSSSSVGDFAGRGFGNGNKSWDYQPDQEGIFLVVGSIIPSAQLYQGYDRNNVHLSKFDFFTPEMDCLGVQAIEKGELYVSPNSSFSEHASYYKGVYGFSGRYGEYKRPKSFVTGDFAVASHYPGGSSWHLMRMFSDTSFGTINDVVHSLNLTRGLDGLQYNRIFQYTGNEFDKFYCFFHFDVGVFAPCKPLFETYEFDENSKKVTLHSNGASLN